MERMDLTRPQPAGGLTVLDLSARLNFRTASSVSFNLGRYG